MHYAVLYDIADHNPIPYLLIPISLYLIIVVFAICAANHGRLLPIMAGSHGGAWMFVLGVGLIVTFIASGQLLLYARYFHERSQGQYRIVEGTVEGFTPHPINGHGIAGFIVDGIGFTYVANDVAVALQQPPPPLQPLQNGSYVRIVYTHDYGVMGAPSAIKYKFQILKLEMLQMPEPSPTPQPSHFPSSQTPTGLPCAAWCYLPSPAPK